MKTGFALKAAIGGVVVVAIGGAVALGRGGSDTHYTTFEVRRGPLDIKVLEGGNVEAIESQEIKSRVKGWQGTKILFIVEEGYFVTEEDVANELKLVELDGSELQEKLTTSQISFKGTQASLTEAEKGYEIEINQSQSDIYASELEMNFALSAMKKFLGRQVAAVVLEAIGKMEIEQAAREASRAEEAESETTEDPQDPAQEPGDLAEQPQEVAQAPQDATADEIGEITIDELRLSHPDVTYSEFARMELLGAGEASQQLRKFEDEVMLAKGDEGQAITELEGKERLYEKDYITENDLEGAKIKRKKHEVSVQSAETSKQLFIEYEFPKQAEKLVSDYIQAKRKLSRTEQQALSKLAQAKAKLLSAQARFQIEAMRIEEYEDQIAKCIMVAERAGLVVYGGSGPRYWDAEPIKEGATIREKQAIITIPDMSKMSAKVKIHESDIKKIAVGQRAEIRVDAYPDRKLDGEVVKVAVLPDAENRWMNPDLKVYETTVKIDGTHEWIKPGMSAEVEILVDRMDDAVYLPIQSVVPQGNKQICFVIENGEPVPREIETGQLTVEYITVSKGLEGGEQVLIRPPEGSRKEETEEEDAEGEEADEASDDEGVADTDDTKGGEVIDQESTDAVVDTPEEDTEGSEGKDDSDQEDDEDAVEIGNANKLTRAGDATQG